MNWIPVRDDLPKDEEWVLVQTQDGTVYPASYKGNSWVPVFRGGLVEHLMHGKVAFWQPRPVGYPYVQCKCGNFFLQTDRQKTCPICASFAVTEEKKPVKKKVEKAEKELEELPFSEPPKVSVDDYDDLI